MFAPDRGSRSSNRMAEAVWPWALETLLLVGSYSVLVLSSDRCSWSIVWQHKAGTRAATGESRRRDGRGESVLPLLGTELFLVASNEGFALVCILFGQSP